MLKSVMAAIWISGGCQAVHAQPFPSGPVTLMMPYAAGGPGDTITRAIGESMSKGLGHPVLVENVVGTGGTIGTARVAAAAPDGHKLLVMHFGHAANTALYRYLPYDAVADFEPIGLMAESPMAFVGRKGLAAASLGDLIAYLRAAKRDATYGFAGIGSASHLCALLLSSAIGTTVTTVPYKGTGPALNDLIGGQFDFMCDQTLNVLPSLKAGLIKGYAVTSRRRLAVAPELPTAHEAGLPNFEITVWFGMYAPKGTPRPIIDRLSTALQQALDDPEVKSRLTASGVETVSRQRARPEALRAHLKAEIDKWGAIIRQAGIIAE